MGSSFTRKEKANGVSSNPDDGEDKEFVLNAVYRFD
jgi:hypothetical protein